MPQKTKRPPREIETAVKTIIPCLWFDRQAEEAANFYISLFPDSHVDEVVEAPADFPSGKRGDVLSVDFTLMGRKFSGLNGGPYFKFNEAVSFTVPCESQAEVDRYWKALSAVPEGEQCGSVKERCGLSRQVVATLRDAVLSCPDRQKAGRRIEGLLHQKKVVLKRLQHGRQ